MTFVPNHLRGKGRASRPFVAAALRRALHVLRYFDDHYIEKAPRIRNEC